MPKKNGKNPIKDLPTTGADVKGGGSMDGINYLVSVTQMKASNANDGALASKPAVGGKKKMG